ncbi:hypothetical protein BH09PAT2_BH09PAT2_02570 [soil metagenome]
MNVLRNFITTYQKSIRDFSFYKQASDKPFFNAIRFVYILTFLVLFINTLLFAITAAFILPSLPGYIETLEKRLNTLYPKNLVVKAKDGVISTNQKEPIYLDIPEISNIADYHHFVTINTKLSARDYRELKTVILVTQNGLVYPDVNNTVTPYHVEKASDLGNTIINYKTYQEAVARLNIALDMLPGIAPWLLISSVILIPILGAFIITIWRMFILAILTCILLPVSSIFGSKLSFNQLYRMGMYGMAIPITLSLILNMAGAFIPMAFASCFLLWMVIVLSKIERKKEAITE